MPIRGRAASPTPRRSGRAVWDIHSPRVPDADEMAALLGLARRRLEDWQIWVNPDCGLKTRRWEEVRPALENLVAAARALRSSVTCPIVMAGKSRPGEGP